MRSPTVTRQRNPGAARAVVALAIAALAASGCAVERSPVAPARPSGPELLLVFGSNRPPTEPLGEDLYYKVLSEPGPAVLVPNINTLSTDGSPSLSADGRWLAYYTQRFFTGSPTTTAVYDFVTGEIVLPPVSRTFFNTFNPAISSGGRYFTFHFQQPGGVFDQLIVVEDMIGDSLLPVPRLNEIGVTSFDPCISGDGSLLAFASNGSTSLGVFDIMLYSVPGDSLIPLPGLNSDQNDLAPAISADGRYIVFQSGRSGGAGLIDVYLYDRQTASLVPLPGFNTGVADSRSARCRFELLRLSTYCTPARSAIRISSGSSVSMLSSKPASRSSAITAGPSPSQSRPSESPRSITSAPASR